MSEPDHALFTADGVDGHVELHVDLGTGAVTDRSRGRRAQASAEVSAALRSLAALVLRGPPVDQLCDLTYACMQSLEVQLDGQHTQVDVWNGELVYGPEGKIVELLRAALKSAAP